MGEVSAVQLFMGKDNNRIVLRRGRDGALRTAQRLKMARSVHAFVRGSTAQFYHWLREAAAPAIPRGPSIWICGDCHVGNLGPVADSEGRVDVQIRDLDQTVVGNPAHDLIRLGLSLATTIRSSDLPGVTTARMLQGLTAGYQAALTGTARSPAPPPAAVRIVVRRALKRTWTQLAEERIVDTSPTIPLGKNFWPLSKREHKAVQKLFESRDVQRLVTCLKSRDDDAPVHVLDAAYWRKGCSSLGRLRIAALVGVGKGREADLSLIDVKEAISPVAAATVKTRLPVDNALRVVEGAKHLSPFLGDRMLAARLLGKAVFMRELRPQDLKVTLDTVTAEEAVGAARFLAGVVGRAHGRQLGAGARRNWCRMLNERQLKSVDAPSWLWASVVHLMTLHEAAYLEHCRRYALDM